METLGQLNGLASHEFEHWLKYRLRLKYSQDPRLRFTSLNFRKLGILGGESHLDDLKSLYDKLSLDAQKAFRDGLCLALQSAKPDRMPLEAMKDLVALVGYIKVPEAIKLFMPLFGEGEWGKAHHSLLGYAVAVSMGLGTLEETHALEEKLGQPWI